MRRINADEWEPCITCGELVHDDDGEVVDGECRFCVWEREKQRA